MALGMLVSSLAAIAPPAVAAEDCAVEGSTNHCDTILNVPNPDVLLKGDWYGLEIGGIQKEIPVMVMLPAMDPLVISIPIWPGPDGTGPITVFPGTDPITVGPVGPITTPAINTPPITVPITTPGITITIPEIPGLTAYLEFLNDTIVRLVVGPIEVLPETPEVGEEIESIDISIICAVVNIDESMYMLMFSDGSSTIAGQSFTVPLGALSQTFAIEGTVRQVEADPIETGDQFVGVHALNLSIVVGGIVAEVISPGGSVISAITGIISGQTISVPSQTIVVGVPGQMIPSTTVIGVPAITIPAIPAIVLPSIPVSIPVDKPADIPVMGPMPKTILVNRTVIVDVPASCISIPWFAVTIVPFPGHGGIGPIGTQPATESLTNGAEKCPQA